MTIRYQYAFNHTLPIRFNHTLPICFNHMLPVHFSILYQYVHAYAIWMHRRVAEFHIRLTFWENLPNRHKRWNQSQIKTKCLSFNLDWVIRSKIGSVISKKGEITLSLQKRELWCTNFETIFCSFKALFFRKLLYFLKSI